MTPDNHAPDSACTFCRWLAAGDDLIAATAYAAATWDESPVSQGHALVFPREHVADLFALDKEVQADIWRLVAEMVDKLKSDFRPDGFNVGVNVGTAAGQTVGHAHVHVIPRRLGDVADPRGGIRRVIPDRVAYWDPE
jgi:diadenosine tetraphosphate (Ap4A) HIT family hydrolase